MAKKVVNKLIVSGQIQDKDRYIPISEAKEQMVDMLTEIYINISEIPQHKIISHGTTQILSPSVEDVKVIIQQKINALKGE